MPQSFHEDFVLRDIAPGSDRAFGLVFGGVFAAVGVLPMLHRDGPRLWSLALAVAFIVVALTVPRSLRRANLLWFRFGHLLSTIMVPVVMAILFFALISPLALVRRWTGSPGLSLGFVRDVKTYWIPRAPVVDTDSLKRQF